MTGQATAIISEHPFLDAGSCVALIDTLNAHPELAVDRKPARPGTFITYGRAGYLDVCRAGADPEKDYFGMLAASNDRLVGVLAEFYEALRLAMEDLLKAPVVYRPKHYALPGIHLFRGSGITSAGEAGAHFDVQYQKMNFSPPPDADAPPLSITVPLRLPANGTGLQVHDVSYADYERAYRMGRISSLEQLVQRKTSAYYAYNEGRIVLHRGLIVHALCSPGPIRPEDERITAQGHGIRCGGTWILYW